MPVFKEIENALFLLRKVHGLDTRRLTYEVTAGEWQELTRELEQAQPWRDLSYAESLTYKGLRIRKQTGPNAAP